ncbi:MAG TPA: ArgE/DapE family deacylase, partial [Terriglobales bacterium]|nr:ArgE/DapE family deacylase [Terriglobales bacterium]
MQDSAIKLLCDLVAIDSVNPSLVPGGAGEAEVAHAAAQYMRAAGLDVEVNEVVAGRPNVVGILESRSPGPTLMFCGHLDTVGVIGMTGPFDPTERDGKLYGRGTQDMKGGVAAMISAAESITKSGGLKSGRLIIAGVIDEEYKSLGAEALVKTWRADAAVITEPTDLVIGIGHKGYQWVEVETKGRAAHGSLPKEGRDAILRMGRVLARLEALSRKLQAKPPHPILGTASLHASLIEGGRELSTYPDHCSLKMERRTIVGEPEDTALVEAEEILHSLKQEDAEFEGSARMLFGQPPYETPSDHMLSKTLESVMDRLKRKTNRSGMTFWTDAAILGKAGIPTVVFGPGGAGLHGLNEYVVIDEVLACRDALVELTHEFCS